MLGTHTESILSLSLLCARTHTHTHTLPTSYRHENQVKENEAKRLAKLPALMSLSFQHHRYQETQNFIWKKKQGIWSQNLSLCTTCEFPYL